MSSAPITPEWLVANGFSQPTASSVDGYSYYYRYISGYHAIEVRYETRNQQWQWKLAEHRDHLNWDDKACTLPMTCQPQFVLGAERLINILEGSLGDL